MRTTTRAAAAVIAGGLGLVHPNATPRTLPPKPAHVRAVEAPSSQPASAPASQPSESAHQQALRAYRATMRGTYDDAIVAAAERWNIDPFLVRGLFQHESKMDPKARNQRTGASGMPQFTPSGAAAVGRLQRARGLKRVFGYSQTLDWQAAIPAAVELLSYLRDTCSLLGDGVEFMLAGYNTGRCSARVPRFVNAVLRHANTYRLEAALPPLPAATWWKKSTRRRVPTHGPES